MSVSVISWSEFGPEVVVREHRRLEVLGDDVLRDQVGRVDLVQRRLVAVEVHEVRVGDAVVEDVVQPQVREHRLLRGRADRPAVVLDRHVAVGRLPVAHDARGRALGQVVEVGREQVARPGLVEPRGPLGDGLILGVADLDVADAVELLQVGHRLVHELRVLGVDVGDPLAKERHRDRLAVLGEERDLAAVLLGLPEDVPRLRHAGDVLGDVVVAPEDAGRVGACTGRCSATPSRRTGSRAAARRSSSGWGCSPG